MKKSNLCIGNHIPGGVVLLLVFMLSCSKKDTSLNEKEKKVSVDNGGNPYSVSSMKASLTAF